MSTKNIELVVPFSFCEKCQLCTVESVTNHMSTIDDKEERLETTYFREHNNLCDLCVNVFKLYMESKKENKNE